MQSLKVTYRRLHMSSYTKHCENMATETGCDRPLQAEWRLAQFHKHRRAWY